MSKIAYFTVLSIAVLMIVTAINIHGVNASEETKFVPVPVLAQDRSNYAVDENASVFHRVSPDIVVEAAEDFTPPDSVTTIPYTVLPPEGAGPTDSNDEPQTVDKPDKEHGNGNGGPNPNNGNGNGNGNNSDNGNGHGGGNDQDHGKDSGKDNNSKDRDKGVGDKPSKSSPK